MDKKIQRSRDAARHASYPTAWSGDIIKPLFATTVWDPGSIIDGNGEKIEVTVKDAAVGDLVTVSFESTGLQKWLLSGYVPATDTVGVIIYNLTGGTEDLPSGRLRIIVWHVVNSAFYINKTDAITVGEAATVALA